MKKRKNNLKIQMSRISNVLILLCLTIVTNGQSIKTKVTICQNLWYVNDVVINKGTPAEGLLLNVRMVNSVFEDRGHKISEIIKDFDPIQNTEKFVEKVPEYVKSGVNAFTISLQGGHPGYEGAINTAFKPDGKIRKEYLNRVEKIIKTCDENHAVVILSCFYQRQHSHFSALSSKESIKSALINTVKWITKKKFQNVILEISNEYRHGGYSNWGDGKWIRSQEGQIELLKIAKQMNPEILISTSGMGSGTIEQAIIDASDYILLHFNNTPVNEYKSKIGELKKYGKPIVCNEDDKTHEAGALALASSIANGCGWGYMNLIVNQKIPFEYYGIEDDSLVYRMFRNAITPGYQFDTKLFDNISAIITFPFDGQIFTVGQKINIQISLTSHQKSAFGKLEIFANNKKVALADNNNQAIWVADNPGTYILEAVLTDYEDNEVFRSSKIDILVNSK